MTATISREITGSVVLQVESIEPSPLNPRTHFNQVGLDELAKSLHQDGLLQPILVRPAGKAMGYLDDRARFLIVAGERRWRAARQLGWTEIAAIVREDVDEALHVRLALLENLARTDLDPLEEASGYQKLQLLGMTQAEIAAAVHRSQPSIANAIRLLKAPQAVQDKLQAGEISPSHVLALLRYEAFPEALVKIAEVAAEKRTPSKELDKELSWEFSSVLREAKLSVDVSSAVFDWQRVCKKCPFGAFAEQRYGGQCLKPEHFRELQKEQRAKDKAKLHKQLDKPAGGDAKTTLKLSALKYGQYEQIYTAPEGCSAACDCRRSALSYGNQAVQVCLKPAEYRRKHAAQREREAAERRRTAEDLSKRCGDRLDQLSVVASRELALLAVDALGSLRGSKEFEGILAKHAPGFKARGKRGLEDLAALQPLQLVKIAVEALLSKELGELHSYAQEAPYATWYAGSPPKAAAGKKRGKKAAAGEPEAPAADDQVEAALAANADRMETELAQLAGAIP